MKATIDFDDALYRRLKIEAARRGRTVRDLVAEGVRHMLDAPATPSGRSVAGETAADWRPAWFGSLGRYVRAGDDHSMTSVRNSIARGRTAERRR